MSILDTLLIVTALTAALWWAVSRHRRPAVLEAFSFAAASVTVLTLALEDMRWQLVPWQVLAVAVAARSLPVAVCSAGLHVLQVTHGECRCA
jgi:hypothetical protein